MKIIYQKNIRILFRRINERERSIDDMLKLVEEKCNEARAIAKYVRMSPTKVKPVADLVRGKNLKDALAILKFTPGKGSQIVEKVVQSAAANADVKEMNADNLYVAEIYAHQGPTMKRVRPRAQGRAYRIEKRMSNITVVLDER